MLRSTCILFGLVVAVYTAELSRTKRQANFPTQNNFNCPQETGSFVYPNDCSKYYRCDNSVASVEDCQEQLLFNSKNSYCDWPDQVQGDCNKLQDRDNSPASLCANPPPSETGQSVAFQVAHPDFCNAFYTCSAGFLYAPCTFCPENMYFSAEAAGCRGVRGRDKTTLCSNKQYIEHAQKVFYQLSDKCWPLQDSNPFSVLVERFTQEGLMGGNGGSNPSYPNNNPSYPNNNPSYPNNNNNYPNNNYPNNSPNYYPYNQSG